jgi:hypothetical protein
MYKEISKDRRTLYWLALWAIILIAFYSLYQLNYSGKTLATYTGKIDSCIDIGGGRSGYTHHAYVNLQNGSKVKVLFYKCRKGRNVKVHEKRGILYFNTVYTAENA